MPPAVTLSPEELLRTCTSHLAGLLGRSRHSKVEGQYQALLDTVLKDLREGFGTGPFSAWNLTRNSGLATQCTPAPLRRFRCAANCDAVQFSHTGVDTRTRQRTQRAI